MLKEKTYTSPRACNYITFCIVTNTERSTLFIENPQKEVPCSSRKHKRGKRTLFMATRLRSHPCSIFASWFRAYALAAACLCDGPLATALHLSQRLLTPFPHPHARSLALARVAALSSGTQSAPPCAPPCAVARSEPRALSTRTVAQHGSGRSSSSCCAY